MSENTRYTPNMLFEVSWEVCNKVGGIHTVVGTKAQTAIEHFGDDHYIVIGPDLTSESENPEFQEDPNLLKSWRQIIAAEGLRVRVGRWKNVVGTPIAMLVNFSAIMGQKNDILAKLWEDYKVDSISGQWDYVEPVLFGYAAGKVIESYTKYYNEPGKHAVAHFHEWMTASGGLYLRKERPSVATVFTTHATVVGRSIAGNGLPLYSGLDGFNGDDMARQFGVVAKHSIEKAAAHNLDAFSTVSDITKRECKALLDADVTTVTPNGFADTFVWQGEEAETKRREARNLMVRVAEATLGIELQNDPLIVSIGGRYEFKNKGIDEFIDSLGELNNNDKLQRDILAYIMIPCWNHGARRDLQCVLAGQNECGMDHAGALNTTHYLGDADNDPVVNHLRARGLLGQGNRVHTVFVPCYLNGDDGIFNKTYYEMLVGMDVTVFPSYYEPWGYTPLESIAFSVPTVTTDLAGFGLWVEQHAEGNHPGVTVVHRDDTNSPEVVATIAQTLIGYANMTDQEMLSHRESARNISHTALWSNLYDYYIDLYHLAVESSIRRCNRMANDGGNTHEQLNYVLQQLVIDSKPNWTRMMVESSVPERLKPLEELTKNLWWSWYDPARQLFESIDPELWNKVDRNPIDLIDSLNLTKLRELSENQEFLGRMDAVYAEFQKYMAAKAVDARPKIAYFSMEYGLHHTLKIYSGGLGILAGDYLKESSDKNVPMTAVGLLYRYGYFTQRLSAAGYQEASYEPQDFFKLPISPVRDAQGNWVTVTVNFPGRKVIARIWRCDVGRTQLYLMDTDHDLNQPEDRSITHHLYGGDWDNRLKQELLLGIGGIRLLNTLGIESDIYHCNEGHAAFIGLERVHNLISKYDLSFSEAMECVRSSSVFTTHTPVPAGHDAFPEDMIRQYMSHYPDRLKITWEQFINLGKTNPKDPNEKFSMSVLASNMSQEVNGVSWLHGEVSKEILKNIWPGYLPGELHIGYVTNGVHFPTWAATKLKDLYYNTFGESFRKGDYSKENWEKIYNIDDRVLWDTRLYLKERLMKKIRSRVADPGQCRYDSPRQIVQIQESLKNDVLTIGFARRFATYKRAHLLFTNMERLEQIVNNPERPVQFVFAGKAHPADKAGQDLIKKIVEVSKMPQFLGKVIFLQNYDMELARRMVQGVDVWMNTPTRPLEASGTSGEKAVMNGVLHFSVLDGWWVEGYKEGAGWMLPMESTFDDPRYQDEMDAELIYTTIEEQIAPLYYERDENNLPVRWIASVKKCIAEVASQFTTNRMMQDYEDRFYSKLYTRHQKMVADDFAEAREIAAWKRRVSRSWDKIQVLGFKQYDVGHTAIKLGEHYNLEVTLDLGDLKPEDVGVEVLVADQITDDGQNKGKITLRNTFQFELVQVEGHVATFRLNSTPENAGSYDVAIRVYAKNPKLPHRMDFALVKWV
ncbi:alpha-glucan family phosphorylase [Millionella massiliensis]|uniref:alpha-glucan family phosphorylase n=1 Tax=Millionella massiliensis TaxID=1871023 RepID=UPI0024B69C35|nr:alpha-glucan family phosphorylase [Millionella massiliensis]